MKFWDAVMGLKACETPCEIKMYIEPSQVGAALWKNVWNPEMLFQSEKTVSCDMNVSTACEI